MTKIKIPGRFCGSTAIFSGKVVSIVNNTICYGRSDLAPVLKVKSPGSCGLACLVAN